MILAQTKSHAIALRKIIHKLNERYRNLGIIYDFSGSILVYYLIKVDIINPPSV